MARDEKTPSERRDFLKTVGGAAIALAATADARGQSASGKKAAHEGTQRNPSPDLGLWITWYDLPEGGRDAYLSWLHETYLPGLLRRPGYLWAAHYKTLTSGGSPGANLHHTDDPNVPTGSQYILMIGARDTFVFGNPTPSAIHAALPEQGQKMLAMRVGERVNLMMEAGRCDGLGTRTYKEGLRGAPCMQIGSFNCPFEDEEDMHEWYVQVRLPVMCTVPSSVRTRKLNSVAGWAKHAIFYEFASLEGFRRDYEATNAKSPVKAGARFAVSHLIHAPNGPNSALRIWPPVPKA